MKFIHLTDLHLVPPGQRIEGHDAIDRLNGAVGSVVTEHGDADFVVITGDLTNRGDAESYRVLRDALETLPMPFHLMVGNHDARAEFFELFPDYPQGPPGFVQSTFETPFGRFILLDTLKAGAHQGVLCADRLDWLEAQLNDSVGPVFLFMHHPPFSIGLKAMDAIGLEDAGAFAKIVAPRTARIRHLFFGHVHRPVWGTWKGIPFSAMRGTCHQMALDLISPVGTYTARAEPPAYGVVLVDADQVTVHMHDYTSGGAPYEIT